MKEREYQINEEIKEQGLDTNLISDGYHTFGELYRHRIALYIALLQQLSIWDYNLWWSDTHYDGSKWDGWLIVGCKNCETGEQISYHVNADEWQSILEKSSLQHFAKSPYEFDGHTSDDVVDRLIKWFM